MDIEKLIERLKHDYHGYSTVENNPEETFHDMVECLTALSTLQAENEKLREMYQEEKAVGHAVQAELENYRKGHCAEGGCAAEKDRDAVLAELEQVKRALAMMWFSYVNSDKETPHSYETEALKEAEGILGPWEKCMPKYLKRGQKED